MIEKIKDKKNMLLIILMVILTITAIVLGNVVAKNHVEANANAKVSDTSIQKKDELQQFEEIIDAENLDDTLENTEEVNERNTETDKDIKYFIRVNYLQNVVTIYTKDSKGEYTVPYKAMICSTGTATPRSGTYSLPGSGTKLPRGQWGLMVGNVWAQYFTRIKDSILFHSVPYTERNKWSLEYWEYDKLGTVASAGCIRLTVEDAKWIYNNCSAGTKVEFYSDSNPGPLGKPTAQKISQEELVRGWDPTDPDASNPWKTYNIDQDEEQNTGAEVITDPEEGSMGEEITTPSEGENTGETVTPDKEENAGGTTTPDKEENTGGTTTPDKEENTGGTTTPDKEENTGETATPDKEENTGETTTTDKGENPEGETTTSSEGEKLGEETTKPSEG